MKYQIKASPAKGQTITKEVEGIHELRDYLAECKELGYNVKKVNRIKSRPMQFANELQLV